MFSVTDLSGDSECEVLVSSRQAGLLSPGAVPLEQRPRVCWELDTGQTAHSVSAGRTKGRWTPTYDRDRGSQVEETVSILIKVHRSKSESEARCLGHWNKRTIVSTGDTNVDLSVSNEGLARKNSR